MSTTQVELWCAECKAIVGEDKRAVGYWRRGVLAVECGHCGKILELKAADIQRSKHLSFLVTPRAKKPDDMGAKADKGEGGAGVSGSPLGSPGSPEPSGTSRRRPSGGA